VEAEALSAKPRVTAIDLPALDETEARDIAEAVMRVGGMGKQSLARLADPSPADRVVSGLGSSDKSIRGAILDYLIAAKPASALPTVLQSLPNEKERNLVPKYVQYLAAVARENDFAARTLLPLLDREKMDFRDLLTMVEKLAAIAPKEHEPTLKKLHEWIDAGETGSLALAAATTLRSLGDKSGMKQLLATINEQMKLAAANGYTVRESVMTRYDLYNAGEIFLTGTAAEVIPVVDVDGRRIGTGTPGPVTSRLKADFHRLVRA
jgi:hypothetical protein